jgi:hypothetical protein
VQIKVLRYQYFYDPKQTQLGEASSPQRRRDRSEKRREKRKEMKRVTKKEKLRGGKNTIFLFSVFSRRSLRLCGELASQLTADIIRL